VHGAMSGAFKFLATTPRDPLFWAYHKFISGVGGPVTLPIRRAASDPNALGVLAPWEQAKSAGPPGITGTFPPRDLSVAILPAVAVFFWEPVTGVTPG